MTTRTNLTIEGQRLRRLLIVQVVGGLGMLAITLFLLVSLSRSTPDSTTWLLALTGSLLVIGLSLGSHVRLRRVNQKISLAEQKLTIEQQGQTININLREVASIELHAINVGRFPRHFFRLLNRQKQQLGVINTFMFDQNQIKQLLQQVRTNAPNITYDDGVKAYLTA